MKYSVLHSVNMYPDNVNLKTIQFPIGITQFEKNYDNYKSIDTAITQ